jgi:cytochrome c oxidase subunit 1
MDDLVATRPAEVRRAASSPRPDADAHRLGFWRRWVFSTDHKVIGRQYLLTGVFFLLFAGALALLLRIQIARPFARIPLLGDLLWPSTGGSMPPEAYTSIFTMHGALMVFFAITPILIGGFGNFLIPLQIGAGDMAFPRLNMISYWVLVPGAILMLASFFLPQGAASAGWTAYAPLASDPGMTLGLGQTLWILGIVLAGTSTLLGAINYLATILNLRCPGMSMGRLPLTSWGFFFTSVLNLLWIPVVAGALILLLVDRVAGTSFLQAGPRAAYEGGQPLLYQHLFWGFGHPEVYILIFPVWGMVGDLLSVFSRKPAFGYRATVASMAAITVVSQIVWGHHMFTSGMNPLVGKAFMFLTVTVSIPTAIFFLNWLGTLWRGAIRFEVPMLFTLGVVFVFAIGGLTGLFNALQTFDLYIHDTYFVVGHFHFTLAASVLFGAFAAIYFWFPKMFGRALPRGFGFVHFLASFVTLNVVFLAMMRLGIGGMMRRIADPSPYEFLRPLQGWNVVAAWATGGLVLAQLPFVFVFVRGLFGRRTSPANPWGAATLEWTVPSPPPHGNFARTPAVHGGPHEYGRPGQLERDWVGQDEPQPAALGSGGGR